MHGFTLSASIFLGIILNFNFGSAQTGVCSVNTNINSCGPGHFCVKLTETESACLCSRGYAPTGPITEKCQRIDICKQGHILCFKNGECITDTNDPVQYTCKCPQGYAGTNCEREQNVCDTASSCRNGATCVVKPGSATQYSCICTRGFTGDFCEVPVSIGIGGAGVSLNGGSLVLLWGLWIAMAMTFLYCGMNIITGWWTKRVRKVATQAATQAATTAAT